VLVVVAVVDVSMMTGVDVIVGVGSLDNRIQWWWWW